MRETARIDRRRLERILEEAQGFGPQLVLVEEVSELLATGG